MGGPFFCRPTNTNPSRHFCPRSNLNNKPTSGLPRTVKVVFNARVISKSYILCSYTEVEFIARWCGRFPPSSPATDNKILFISKNIKRLALKSKFFHQHKLKRISIIHKLYTYIDNRTIFTSATLTIPCAQSMPLCTAAERHKEYNDILQRWWKCQDA